MLKQHGQALPRRPHVIPSGRCPEPPDGAPDLALACWRTLVLGIVQSQFLPISSTAHLLIVAVGTVPILVAGLTIQMFFYEAYRALVLRSLAGIEVVSMVMDASGMVCEIPCQGSQPRGSGGKD